MALHLHCILLRLDFKKFTHETLKESVEEHYDLADKNRNICSITTPFKASLQRHCRSHKKKVGN